MADSPSPKPAHRPWPPQIDDGWPIPSPREIAAAKQDNGYYKLKKLKQWGIPTNKDAYNRELPVAGWRPRMEALWRKANPRTWPVRQWPPVQEDGFPTPSPDEIAAAKKPSGYYDEDKLAEWGIPFEGGYPSGWPLRMAALWRKVEAENAKAARQSRPWPVEEPDGWPLPSPEEIAAAKGANGYWPREKLEEWGVPQDPAPPVWRETLERAYWRNNIPAEVYELLGEAYDEEGVQIAWLNPWRGMKRWRMFEMWWEDPDQVRRALRPPATEIQLAHIDGAGRIILKLPMPPELAADVLEALSPLGWAPLGDSSLLFEEAEG